MKKALSKKLASATLAGLVVLGAARGGIAGELRVISLSDNVSALRAESTAKGVRISGIITRGVGHDAERTVCVRVISADGRLLSSTASAIAYAARRPLIYNRRGAFSVTVPVQTGATIRVDAGPNC